MKCYHVIMLLKPITRHSVALLSYLSEEHYIMGIHYIYVEYG